MGGGLSCSSCCNALPPVGLLILHQPLLAVSRYPGGHRKGQDAVRGIVDPMPAVEKAVLARQVRQNIIDCDTPPLLGIFLGPVILNYPWCPATDFKCGREIPGVIHIAVHIPPS